MEHVRDAISLGAFCVYGGLPINDLNEQGGHFIHPAVLVNIIKDMKVYKVCDKLLFKFGKLNVPKGRNVWSSGVGNEI